MESVSLKHMILTTPTKQIFPIKRNPIRVRRRRTSFGVKIDSKLSDFQDFQGYAKPSRLLPATQVKICTETSQEKFFPSFSARSPRSLFKVKLQTSNAYGSNLSDLNAGILLCLIDENGDSILQRIPASLMIDHSTDSGNMVDPDVLYFQRGTVDEFTFEGPKLGRIEALWISLESGQWRLGGLSLTVICASEPSFEDNDGESFPYIGYHYDFEALEILLGEGSDMSMVELRPCHTTKLSGADPFTLLSKSLPQSTSFSNVMISNEESMGEYADLKLSLLVYDAFLIFVGTTVVSLSAGESAAFAFFTGGVGGFLYLLLLQRSVDGLPSPEETFTNTGGKSNQTFGVKAPITSLILAVGFGVIAVNYSSGDASLSLTPKELIVGMMGFLACKVAVVLAAFKPMPIGLKMR